MGVGGGAICNDGKKNNNGGEKGWMREEWGEEEGRGGRGERINDDNEANGSGHNLSEEEE